MNAKNKLKIKNYLGSTHTLATTVKIILLQSIHRNIIEVVKVANLLDATKRIGFQKSK